ncbi:MAG: efflux RND transporter periplasmic adaptor subunit [Nitrospirota bacterium]|nr:efflux RND transporter periplasmic adaptor subunit [Nitrospirota bacterium]
MITVILLAWMGFLWALIKIGVFKGWATWMKWSPLVIYVLANLFLLIPMNFGSPSGPLIVINPSIQIVPSVSGIVTEVAVTQNRHVAAGDELFRIDDTLYRAEFDRLQASVELARVRLASREKLAQANVLAQEEMKQAEIELRQLVAQLTAASWKLEQTIARAPTDGFVSNVILQPGARVIENSSEVMALVDGSAQILGTQIAQNYIRYVRKGQPVEVIFKQYPGEVFTGEVVDIIGAGSKGLLEPTGGALDAFEITPDPVWVAVSLDDDSIRLSPGAVGTSGIYTDEFLASRIFRKIVLRMENWTNYL